VSDATPTGTAERSDEDGFINETRFLQRVPVCRRTLYQWRERGIIPSVKIGKRVLFHWPSCQAALLRMQAGGVQ